MEGIYSAIVFLIVVVALIIFCVGFCYLRYRNYSSAHSTATPHLHARRDDSVASVCHVRIDQVQWSDEPPSWADAVGVVHEQASSAGDADWAVVALSAYDQLPTYEQAMAMKAVQLLRRQL